MAPASILKESSQNIGFFPQPVKPVPGKTEIGLSMGTAREAGV
jgi:hypothetical protein